MTVNCNFNCKQHRQKRKLFTQNRFILTSARQNPAVANPMDISR